METSGFPTISYVTLYITGYISELFTSALTPTLSKCDSIAFFPASIQYVFADISEATESS